MAPVKLDSPVKVFVVSAARDSIERTAAKVFYVVYSLQGSSGPCGIPYLKKPFIAFLMDIKVSGMLRGRLLT